MESKERWEISKKGRQCVLTWYSGLLSPTMGSTAGAGSCPLSFIPSLLNLFSDFIIISNCGIEMNTVDASVSL